MKKINTFFLILALLIAASMLIPAAALAYDAYEWDDTDIAVVTEKPALPDWYPEDIDAWTWSEASPNAPRVIDNAGLFTETETASLESRIKDAKANSAIDIVIYTDYTDYGLGKDIFAADVYDFLGYGVGPEHDGFCLFIDMDPNDRGGWCCVTGAPREYYTYENANALDDVLYEYLGSAEYYEGVFDWIGNLETLMDKGIPFAPDWYRIDDGGVRRRDPNVTRVYDSANLFTAEEEADLKRIISEISEKYGTDVVIHSITDRCGFSDYRYAGDFFRMNGYGKGDNYNGVLLLLEPNETDVYTATFGKQAADFTDRNISRLNDRTELKLYSGNYYKAAKSWLKDLEKTLRTGHTPRTTGSWISSGLVSTLIGALGGAIGTGSAKSKMKTVRRAYSAGDHLVNDSLAVTRTGDEFLRSEVSRVYSPVSSDSGRGGSSGGGSSHSSSYSGSSGTSHSGSGRSF